MPQLPNHLFLPELFNIYILHDFLFILHRGTGQRQASKLGYIKKNPTELSLYFCMALYLSSYLYAVQVRETQQLVYFG